MKDEEDDLPVAVLTGTLTIGGSELQVVILDDGRRIIEVQSLEAFFGSMPRDPTPQELAALSEFCRGSGPVSEAMAKKIQAGEVS